MMIVKRNIVKKWFKRFSKPTELQFSNFFDSIWFKYEKIPVSKIEGLNSILIKKADKELFDLLQLQLLNYSTPYNLSFTPTFLNYKYFGQNVYGVFLEIPPFENDKYIFAHNLDISNYLRIEIWEDGFIWNNPKEIARQDLTELVYKDVKGIGFSEITKTKIGERTTGSIKLDKDNIEVTGNYRIPESKLLYIEFLINNDQTIITQLPLGKNKNQK